jgi:hypothetical protein
VLQQALAVADLAVRNLLESRNQCTPSSEAKNGCHQSHAYDACWAGSAAGRGAKAPTHHEHLRSPEGKAGEPPSCRQAFLAMRGTYAGTCGSEHASFAGAEVVPVTKVHANSRGMGKFETATHTVTEANACVEVSRHNSLVQMHAGSLPLWEQVCFPIATLHARTAHLGLNHLGPPNRRMRRTCLWRRCTTSRAQFHVW